jgi:hypothetical protein
MGKAGLPPATRSSESFHGEEGFLIEQSGETAEIRFDLKETQEFINNIPGIRKAYGSLRFDEVEKGCNMYVASENKTLIGGGIHAEIIVALMESFRVIDGLVMKL